MKAGSGGRVLRGIGDGRRRRICLISPGHVAFNPRLVKEADALAEAGYAVHVIAAGNLADVRRFDAPILQRAAWTWDQVGGESRLHDLARRARGKVSRRFLEAGMRLPALEEWGAHPLLRGLAARACAWPADLYIAHYLAAVPAAMRAASRHRAPWGFDAEDYHSGEFADGESDSPAAVRVRRFESTLRTAGHFTAASAGIGRAYATDLGRAEPDVVLNVFPVSEAPERPTGTGTAAPGPSLYWFSQTIGANRGLEDAVRAIGLAQSKPHLYLRGKLAQGFDKVLLDLAEQAGVSGRVHLLPPAEAGEMARLAAAYDVGLVAETGHCENRRIALTNKLFSFLLAGLPIVATDIPAHRDLLPEISSMTLFPSGNAAALARAIDGWLLDRGRLAAGRSESFRLGRERFNWDCEKTKLVAAVERSIGPAVADPSVRSDGSLSKCAPSHTERVPG